MRHRSALVVAQLLCLALLVGVFGQDDPRKSPAEQAQSAGFPLLTEFTIRAGETGTTYLYEPPHPGPQRLIAVWGARVELVIRVRAGEREPLQAEGNPADIRFNAEAGLQYVIALGPAGDLPVTSVGLLYGGPEADAKPPDAPEGLGESPPMEESRPGGEDRQPPDEADVRPPQVGGEGTDGSIDGDLSLAVLQAPALASLKRAGIVRLGELAPRVSTREGLESLSRETNVPAEHLLFLAEDAQLSLLLGGEGVDPAQVSALQRLDITRPEQLARFRGNETQLREMVAAEAERLQAKPTPLSRVREWAATAGTQTAVLPDMRVFRPERPAQRRIEPSSPLLFGDDGAELISDPGPGDLQLHTIVATVLQPGIEIQPNTEYLQEFPAGAGGLYRLDYGLQRKGGFATLAWTIERPIEKLQQLQGGETQPVGGNQGPTVAQSGATLAGGGIGFEITGWQPIIQGGQPLETSVAGAPPNLAMFWVKSKDIGHSRKLRLRLNVLVNEASGATADATGIEQGQANDEAAAAKDPTVRGTISISRVPTQHLPFGSPKWMGFYEPRSLPDLTPVMVFETSRFVKTPLGENPWGLSLKLTPEPNTYAPHLVDPITGAPSQYNPGQRYGGQIVRDDVPVAGEWTADKGLASFKAATPQSGVFDVLLGPGAHPQCFQTLSTTGDVWGAWNPQEDAGPTALQRITAELRLLGGGQLPGSAYVAEIVELRTSGQSEEDSMWQGNDEGLGEFHLDATALFADRADDEEDEYQGKGLEPLRSTLVFPVQNRHFHMPPRGVGDIRMFPRCPVGWWPADEVSRRDTLFLGARVYEADDVTGWTVLKSLGDILSKMLETIVAAWKGDAGGFVDGMKGYLSAIVDYAPVDDVDDPVGYPGMGTTRAASEYGFVAEDDPDHPSPDDVVFDATGPVDMAQMMTQGAAGIGGHTLGYVTTNAADPTWAAVRTRLRRNVPVLWSWAEVQLLDFTVSADLDADGDMQSSPMEVYVIGGYGGCGEYKWNHSFRHNIWGNEDESLGVNLRFWDWDVGANQKVVVCQPSAPQTRQEGAVLLPPSIEKSIQAVPYTYTEIGLWDADPDSDDFIGLFSRTFYHDEVRRWATDPVTAGKWVYSGVNTAKPSRMKCLKEGSFYTCEIIAHNTGNWLDEVHVKAWVYIWEG